MKAWVLYYSIFIEIWFDSFFHKYKFKTEKLIYLGLALHSIDIVDQLSTLKSVKTVQYSVCDV